ncbi:MAG: putative rane protein [Frankiales bacterium]|jgi:signal peptidase I|nr:putative rane protein [Frankiales bacterium]
MRRSIHAVAWVLLVVAAVALWPQRWGGTMTYVLTSGTSMEPMFQAGDLAVLRTAPEYRVGDVVAYRSDVIKQTVMHRVLTEKDGIYTFQGDNNDFVDPDRVRDEQLLGKLALRVPGVGRVVSWLFKPVNVLVVVGALYLLFSDRRKEPAAVPAATAAEEPLVVAVGAFRVPESAVVAELLNEADLHRVAARYGRPVLRDGASGESWVHDGSLVYRYAVEVEQAPEVGSGRDWQYGVDPDVVALLPRPRRQSVQPSHGVDLGKLLKLG